MPKFRKPKIPNIERLIETLTAGKGVEQEKKEELDPLGLGFGDLPDFTKPARFEEKLGSGTRSENPFIDLLLQSRKAGPGSAAAGAFEDLINIINKDSLGSVDEALKATETQGLNLLLGDIRKDTERAVADTELDFFEKGQFGPGILSDVAASSITGARAEGARREAGARTSVTLSDLERLRGRESTRQEALFGAFGGRSQAATSTDFNLLNLLTGVGEGSLGRGTKEDIAFSDILQKLLLGDRDISTRKQTKSGSNKFLEGINLGFDAGPVSAELPLNF